MNNTRSLKTIFGILAIMLLSIVIVFAFSQQSYAAEEVASGTCGENITWQLDDENVLTLSGSGQMYDYDLYGVGEAPWKEYRRLINKIIIQDGITNIGDEAFYRTAVQDITIPDSVTSIGRYAFYACNSLQTISFPDHLQSIGYGVFYSAALETVNIPKSVTNIENSAFAACDSLISINVDSANDYYESLDGVLFDKNVTQLITCPAGKSGNYVVPSTVKQINSSAFRYCKLLTGITIPDSVEILDEYSLSFCSSLTSISIGSNVNYIARGVFEGCYSVESIDVSNDNEFYCSIDGVVFSKDMKTVVAYPSGKKDTSYIVPDTVENINGGAFEANKYIENVTLPEGLIAIWLDAFGSCDSLQEITIPSTVKTISGEAFRYCASLKEAVIKSVDVSFGRNVFLHCSDSLTIIGHVGSTAEEYAKQNGLTFVAEDHVWNTDYTVDKEASCAEEGSKSIHCSACDAIDESTVTVIPKNDHTYGDWKVTKEATCTEDGSREKACEVCGYKVTEKITATGHTPSDPLRENEVAATCDKEGSYDEVVYCSVCKEEISREKKTVEALGHNWNKDYTIDKEATCAEEGSQSIHCSRCNMIDESTVEVIPKVDHTYGDWVVLKEANCTEDGSREKVCDVCGDKVTEKIVATGHTPSDPVNENEVAATCEKDGSYVEVVYCLVCKEEVSREKKTVAALGHNWNKDYTIDKEATCTENGSKSIHCSRCGAIDESTVEVIPKSEHAYGDWKVTKEATCTEDGSKEKICTVCGDKQIEAISATGHLFEDEFTVDSEPTCTKEGSKSKHCTKCEEKSEVTPIDALGHSFGSWVEVTPSSCEGEGVRQHTCDVCGFAESESIDPKGHEWKDDYTVDVPATCTTDGSESMHCKNCEVTKDSRVIPSVGHSYGDWSTIKEPTCTENGLREKVCSACGDKMTEKVAALGHAWNSETTVDKSATCTEDGSQSIHCSRCSETKDAEIIPATGHSFGEWTTTKKATELTAGKQTRTCSVCSATETKTIAQLKPTLPAVKISKVVAGKKYATVKWAKVSAKNQKKIAKIQIQYSTDKNFKKNVKTVYAKKSATSKKITKLTSKKTYYFRIRAYKSSSGKVHVSKWSTVKYAKVK